MSHNSQNIMWVAAFLRTRPRAIDWNLAREFRSRRCSDADDIDKVFRRRSHRMNMCHNLCPQYAEAAAGDVKAAQEAGCVFPNVPGRFDADRKRHFDWCVSGEGEDFIRKEWRERYAFTSKCTVCGTYAKNAASQSEQNSATTCGGTGPGWSIHPVDHYNQCMERKDHVKEWADYWIQYRDNWLRQCPSPTDQAYCYRYADRAMSCCAALAAKKEIGKCNPNSLDSDPDRIANYLNCLWSEPRPANGGGGQARRPRQRMRKRLATGSAIRASCV
ncbi:MAG: hypothetical protein IPL91_14885 [Hyphomicrobium sp.]|nr:hypothetical protein [Hyphomicrobium sp.]